MSDRPVDRIYDLPGGVTATRMQPAIGAVISGVDCHAGISQLQAESMRQALYAHGLIVLQGQEAMTYEDHVALSEVFGTLICEGHIPDRPEVQPIKGTLGSRDGIACYWHSDGVYKPEPEIASILRAIEPCTFGGDTCWSSGVAAYENLSDDLKAQLRDMRFNSSLTDRMPRDYDQFGNSESWNRLREQYPPVTQPAVSVHPVTGARAIYVNQSWTIDIVGMDAAESDAMIALLTGEMLRPEYQTRWQWSKGDVAIWDNRLVQHYGVPDHTADRYLERITVSGGPVIGIADWEERTGKVAQPASA